MALTLATLLVVVGGPELALRLAGHGPSLRRGEMHADPDLLWAFNPGADRPMGRHTTINRLGLQGPEPTRHPRLLATGDSSVFGVSINDAPTFSQVLGEALDLEVHNGGVPGYSSAQSLAQVERVWGALDPTLLVVANLWSDNNFATFVDAEELVQAGRPLARARHLLVQGALRSATLAAMARWVGAEHQQEIGWGQRGQQTTRGDRRVPPADYSAHLDAMARQARQDGAGVIFLILPNVEDVDHPGRPWPWDPYRRLMREAAARHGCPVVDGPALVRATGKGAGELFVDEMHPSATGHQVLGRGLAQAAREAGWPDAAGLCQGEGPASTDFDDPWTWPAGRAPTATAPAVAGVLRGSRRRQEPLTVRLIAPDGAVLDQVELPGAAPFSLQVEPAPARAAVEVWQREPRPARLLRQELELVDGPRWGVTIDLPDRQRPAEGRTPPPRPGAPAPP
ncbi:GDSL-type esterase/lipase family protein [Myxococcota bacterium]|nr:GDSL-type esterase/lipase family protein [Myxococcota bacterium]